MKSQKLIGITAIAYLLLGESGVAMADGITCTDDPDPGDLSQPVINGETVDGDVVVRGNCYITLSVITGNITVDNGLNPKARFALNVSTVGGRLK